MVKAAGTGKKTKPAGRSKTPVVTSSLETLQKAKAAGRQQFARPKRTRTNYDSYLVRGKKFLEDVVQQRREIELMQGKIEDGIDTDELARAFDDSGPNRLSHVALELFLTQKCLTEDKGMSTAEGIRGAFADYWDNMDGDKYRGEYSYNEKTNTVLGCPARASIVKSFMKVVKAKDGAKGAAATRHHAEAMHIEDLAQIMTWSESQVPSAMVGHRLRTDLLGTAGRYTTLKHVLVRAFLSSGFTLWTRNFELCGLQRRDLEMSCTGSSPLYLPFFKVRLENRKGWQNKQGWNGPLENNTYHIYQQSKWELDMFTHLQLWLTVLEQELGRPLEPDDYIFPFISTNGLIDPKLAMSHDVVQTLLSEFSIGSGLNKHFTTHSLRRGGAQYRLMYAPLGERWSLSIIRWWGGWAMGEKVDTLMKYLIDSLQSYENGYNDALCPTRLDSSKTFMGEGDLLRTATVHDLHVLVSAIMSTVRSTGFPPTYVVPGHETTHFRQPVSPLVPPPTIPSETWSSLSSESGVRTNPPTDILMHGNTPQIPFVPPKSFGCVQNDSTLQPASRYNTLSDLTPKFTNERGLRKKQPLKHCAPIPGIVIPNLGRKKGSWKVAVKQWEEGDPSTGLVALKDWPREWYTGVMRTKTGTKRHQREMIANEYQRLGRNDAAFDALYSGTKGQSALIRAIRKNHPDYRARSRTHELQNGGSIPPEDSCAHSEGLAEKTKIPN